MYLWQAVKKVNVPRPMKPYTLNEISMEISEQANSTHKAQNDMISAELHDQRLGITYNRFRILKV